jgi:hypothetical protein
VGRLLEEAIDLRGHESRAHEPEEQESADSLVGRLLVELLLDLMDRQRSAVAQVQILE